MRKNYLTLLFLVFIVVSCSLSASQEQELNKQTGLYLDAKEKNSILQIVSKTHPSFVKYAQSKGNDYFMKAFEEDAFEELTYLDPRILKIKSKGDKIQVLYEVGQEYILNGENRHVTQKLVALSDNDGESWFFLEYSAYNNEKICKEIPRLLK